MPQNYFAISNLKKQNQAFFSYECILKDVNSNNAILVYNLIKLINGVNFEKEALFCWFDSAHSLSRL